MSSATESSRARDPAAPAVASQRALKDLATLLLQARAGNPGGGLAAGDILDLLPAAVYVCDAAGRIAFYNRRAAELWGREPRRPDDRERFCPCHAVFRPDGTPLPPELSPMALAVREGRVFRGVETIIARPDGARFDASSSIDPLRDETGRLCGAIQVFQDVTERKSRERRAGLIDELSARLAPLSDELAIVRTATAFVGEHLRVARCGFIEADESRDEIVVGEGWRPEGVTTIAGRYRVGQLLQPAAWRAIAGGAIAVADIDAHPLTQERAARYAPLGVRAFLVCPCRQAQPRVFMLGVAQERARAWTPDEIAFVENVVARVWPIVERARSEAALRRSEERLRLATQSGKVGIWDWDIPANRVTWTDSLYAIHGVSPETFPGTVEAFGELVHPDDRQPVQRAIHSSLEHGVPYELEFRAVRPGGAIVWLFTSAIVVRENGQPVRMHGASFDITARKHAELALRESEKRFRTLASHAPVGIFLTDPDGATLFVNESWTRMTGLAADQARGEGWSEAIHPDDRARVTAGWEEAVRRGEPSVAEYRFRRADGTITWVQGNAVQVRDHAGRLTGYIGTIADFTARKDAEEKLRAQEAQLSFIANNAPVSLAHCDRDGRYLFVNRANAGRMGLTVDAIIGRTVTEIIGEAGVRAIQPYIDRVLRGEAFTYEVAVPYRSRGTRYVRVAYAPDVAEDGTVRGWLAAISDITERREIEDALRESEERFRQLADAMPQIVWGARADGTVDYFNRRWYEFTAQPPEACGDESFFAVLHPDDRERCRAAWHGCVASGEPYQIEHRLRRAGDGESRWHLGRALPVRGADGAILRWFGTCTDIHDSKLVRDQLQEARGQLEAHAAGLEQKVDERTASLREAIVQMEEFSYSVSHDLRAPLRAMNAYAGALLEDYAPQLDDTARDYLARIQRSSRRMERLTHDVLTYSRLARSDVTLTRVNVAALVRDLILQYAELQPAAADVAIEEPLPEVLAHETSLGQCLANLLTNAAKFVAPGVRPRICVRAESAKERVRVWIEDNGIGIDARHQERLFRVFERVPTPQAYDGTGIGLAIVRRAIEKMGGRCGVESDGRTGSRFWIELAAG